MKINVKNLANILVIINALILFGEIPNILLMASLIAVVLSWLIQHPTVRNTLKISIMIGALAFIKYQFKTFLVTEAGVSFILILASLKLWEMDKESDHFNMFLILALLESCLFLLKPTFPIFFLGMLKIILFFYFILKIRNYDLSLLNGKRLLILATPSLVFSLILFYTFPRFTSGFINATNPQLLFSGVDSQLNFKQLGPLNLSSKIVFRVFGLNPNQFPIPMLYWRENILWDFQKDEWKTGYLNMRSEQQPLQNPIVNYRVQLEKDYNEFLPVLDGMSTITKSNLDYNFFSEGSFRLKNISKSMASYEANSNYQSNWKLFTPIMERKGLRLKSTRKKEIEDRLFKDNKPSSEADKLKAVENFFRQRQFEYSLNPPFYNSLEDFILFGKKGYCSHFASAFAYLARLAGLPTRIVSGYQGGEYNPFDQTVLVREQDAHAWVEIYFKEKGWIKYDPTQMVAPGRIQLGSNLFHESLEPYVNLFYYKLPKSFLKFKFVDQTSLWIDSMNTTLSYNILNFDKERQQQLLQTYFSKRLSLNTLFIIGLLIALSATWLFFKWLSRDKTDARERRYKKFILQMKRAGALKDESETATLFSQRCMTLFPELAPYIQRETEAYIESFYKS